MEAHAGTIRIPTGTTTKPRRLHLFRERLRARRRERAIRHYAAGAHRVPTSVPGSEHTHLILPPKAY